jgi:DNA-binding protein YbaB
VKIVEHPDGSAILDLIDDLNRALHNAEQTQRKIVEVTGTAWSPDRLIKAVVGPRGQLVELEFDARACRRQSSDLAALIVATVRAAAEQAMSRTQEIIEQSLPGSGDFWQGAGGDGPHAAGLAYIHDADLKRVHDGG